MSDDRSYDGTWEEHLVVWTGKVRSTTSIHVTLLRNETHLGLTSNFELAVRALVR